MKYQKIVYSLGKNVTCCNWPKRLGIIHAADSCCKGVVKVQRNNLERCCWKGVIRQWLYLGVCVVFAVAAMLSKETGITVLGMCIIYDVIYCHSWKKVS